jgi:NADPH:quinone reductase-like Zn-dependent oxidoreductase
MVASAINPSDLLTICGTYSHRTALPFVPGYEGVGVVAAVADDVRDLHVGQRVLPLGSAGGWAAHKTVPSRWCVVVPNDLPDDDAALSYVNPLTAHLMLERIGPLSGQSVGINAAASAIGRMLIRSLKKRGAHPVAVVRSEQSAYALDGERVETIVCGEEQIPALDHALDAVGGEAGRRMAAAVRTGGVFLYYGLLSGYSLPVDLHRSTSAKVMPFWLREWVHQARTGELHAAMKTTFENVRTGLARTAPVTRFPLCDFRAALAFNAANGRQGKTLLIP